MRTALFDFVASSLGCYVEKPTLSRRTTQSLRCMDRRSPSVIAASASCQCLPRGNIL
jgi:hypothetical protein